MFTLILAYHWDSHYVLWFKLEGCDRNKINMESKYEFNIKVYLSTTFINVIVYYYNDTKCSFKHNKKCSLWNVRWSLGVL